VYQKYVGELTCSTVDVSNWLKSPYVGKALRPTVTVHVPATALPSHTQQNEALLLLEQIHFLSKSFSSGTRSNSLYSFYNGGDCLTVSDAETQIYCTPFQHLHVFIRRWEIRTYTRLHGLRCNGQWTPAENIHENEEWCLLGCYAAWVLQ
jgi:hypothetical protein